MREARWILMGGRVVEAGRFPARPWDALVRWGAGVFETIGCQDGCFLLLEAHRARLTAAVDGLGWRPVAVPDGEVLNRLLRRSGLETGPAALRLIAYPRPGGTSVVGWAEPFRVPASLRRRGAWLHPVEWPSGDGPLMGVKSTSYLAFRQAAAAARRAGAESALLVESDGTIREADHANLFVRLGREILTPPAPERCLPGIVRAWCLDALPRVGWPVREENLSLASAPHWEEAWLTSSLAGVVPVRGVGEVSLRTSPEVVPRLVAAGVPAPAGT